MTDLLEAVASADLVTDLLARCDFGLSDGPMAIACSGGPDSCALAVLAAAAGRGVVLHHVDHQLRSGGSVEAALVAELARRLGGTFVAHVVDLPAGEGLEDRARRARRGVLPASAATGHTMDDQAETVLLNLLRGTGSAGVGAMRPGPTHPILRLRRSETRELCKALGLETVADPTNEDLDLRRNAVRHRLLPLIDELAGRDVAPLLARSSDHARADDDLLESLAEMTLPDPTDCVALRSAPTPLASRAIRRWLTEVRASGTVAHPPSSAEVERVMAVVRGEVRAAEVAGSVRVARTRGSLRAEAPIASTLIGVGGARMQVDRHSWAAAELGDVVLSGEQIQQRVAELGAQITADYADNPPLIVCVLKGAMHFVSDISRAIDLPVEIDFMAVSSYGSATKTSGVVRIVKDLDMDLTNRHVLVVEDIIDSGLTLNYLRKYLSARIPASLEVCTLLLKEGEQKIKQDLRYVGFTIPPSFVVGYGLDVAERYRNLEGVYTFVGHDGPGGTANRA